MIVLALKPFPKQLTSFHKYLKNLDFFSFQKNMALSYFLAKSLFYQITHQNLINFKGRHFIGRY